MSTKITLFYNQEVHVYQECFDEDNVFVNFDSVHFKVTKKLSLEEFVGIGSSINYDSMLRQAEVTDEQIRSYVESRVAARSQTHCPFSQFHETTIFGDMSDPVQQQIARGVAFYSKKRYKIKSLVEKVNFRKQNYFFGLEDLL